MERTLKVTRIYSLGEYQNIQLTDELIIQDGWNPQLIDELSYYQLLVLEKRFTRYVQMKTKYRSMGNDEILAMLADEEKESLARIFTLYKKE